MVYKTLMKSKRPKSSRKASRTKIMTTIFTATTYAIDWIANNIEIDSRAITALSGKRFICEKYEENCKKNR